MKLKGIRFLRTGKDFTETCYCSDCGQVFPNAGQEVSPPSLCSRCHAETIMEHYPTGSLLPVCELAK